MRAIAVKPDEVKSWQERLTWHFDSFCKDKSLDPADLWNDVSTQQRQLWVLQRDDDVQAVILTSVTDDNHQTCEVTHAAGYDRVAWQHLWPALEHWARSIGCKRIRATARPGWERILDGFGMKKTHVVLEREL